LAEDSIREHVLNYRNRNEHHVPMNPPEVDQSSKRKSALLIGHISGFAAGLAIAMALGTDSRMTAVSGMVLGAAAGFWLMCGGRVDSNDSCANRTLILSQQLDLPICLTATTSTRARNERPLLAGSRLSPGLR
jgi:hypothetical protein